jgi:hypothetical protein
MGGRMSVGIYRQVDGYMSRWIDGWDFGGREM